MAVTPFEQYCSPKTSQEVVELLTKYGDKALLLAGGTFIHSLAARGLLSKMEALIDLQEIGLSYVKPQGGGLAVGAMTTFRELAEAAAVKDSPGLGAIRDALEYPPPQIQNMATVGGCTASAYPLFDLPVALLALSGVVKAEGPGGRREFGLDQFFRDYLQHTLARGEFLSEIFVAKLAPGSASAFLKLETNANDLALLNVGTRITLDEAGICKEVRVVFGGGVGGVPVRAMACEPHLQGSAPNVKLLNEAAEAVSVDLHPASDHRASAQYRMAVAKVLVRKALVRALGRLGVKIG